MGPGAKYDPGGVEHRRFRPGLGPVPQVPKETPDLRMALQAAFRIRESVLPVLELAPA